MSLATPRKGYKSVPWLFGKEIEIPEEWESSKLKEVVILSQGLQVPEENQSSEKLDGYERFLRIVDYQEEIPPRYVEISKRQAITNEKTIVMVRYGAGAGNVYTGLKGVIANNLFQIISKKDNLKNNFLYIFLKRDFIENYLRHISGTTTMPNINHGLVYNLIILLPSLPEQQKIATILSNVDNLIESTGKVITHSKKVKTGLMQKLLTRGIGHVTFKKVPWLFGKEIEIPDEWEVKTISELGKIVTGSTPDTTNKKYFGNDFLWASPIDFEGEKYITQTNSMLSEKGLSISRKIPKDTVLVVCIGSTIGKIGMASVEMSTNQQINSIICNNVDSNFIYYQLQQNNYLIKNRSNQSAVPIINKTEFGKFKLILPNEIQKQQKIATILSNIDDKITSQEQYKEKLEKLKKSLMQKLLTGEVRV